MRQASVSRTTKETSISVSVNLDGTGKAEVDTGVGFFDHMLDQIARHSLIDLKIEAKGDLHIDFHHTVEDTESRLGRPSGRRSATSRYHALRRLPSCDG